MMQLTLKQKISFSILLVGIVFGGIWYFFFQKTSSADVSTNSSISESVAAVPENNDDIRIRHVTLIDKALKEAHSS
jgi:hypothetical protein